MSILVVLVAWLVQVIGVAAYSIFPATADRRLSQVVRLFTLYGGLLPIGLAAAPGLVLRNPLVAALGCAVAAAGEASGLIAFAAWRIQGNGIAMAREETQ
jgi:hypothetical protein